jgi:hypothetical protein
VVLCILTFTFLDSRRKTIDSEPSGSKHSMLIAKYYESYQIKEDMIGRACSRRECNKRYIKKLWLESLKVRILWEGLGLYESIILKRISRNLVGGCGLGSCGSVWRQVASENKTSCSINRGSFTM